jgi:3-methyladenine DNA glycosylase Mpg
VSERTIEGSLQIAIRYAGSDAGKEAAAFVLARAKDLEAAARAAERVGIREGETLAELILRLRDEALADP